MFPLNLEDKVKLSEVPSDSVDVWLNSDLEWPPVIITSDSYNIK